MKTGFILQSVPLLLAVAVLQQGCQKAPVESPIVVEEPATPAPIAVKAPAATPSPIAVATPLPDPLAPPGVFYLLQKISITTDDGIVGLKPGQLIREVSPGVYEADGHRVEVRTSQMTNNLRIARQFALAEAGSQAALRAASAERPTPPPTVAAASTATVPASTISSQPKSASARPAAPIVPISSGISSAPRLGSGTGTANPETGNKKNTKMDNSGRLYWRDSQGRIRYDF